jgi:DtxR family transcriptional regulator, Mn-dependent transcriptional regulator
MNEFLFITSTCLVVFLLWRIDSRERITREALEDTLKKLLDIEREGGKGSLELLAGALMITRAHASRLVGELASKGYVRIESHRIELTAEGRAYALRVMRAHRLWERYFADEAGMSLEEIHDAAHRAEHLSSAEALDELDARLGHPLSDPHGDAIPQRDGTLYERQMVGLSEWPLESEFQVAHIEDEPEFVFHEVLASGIRPGAVLKVARRLSDTITLLDGPKEINLSLLAAGAVQGVPVPAELSQRRGAKRLSELRDGKLGRVVTIDAECRGFTRRRLLDLGLTPSTLVRAELKNAFGDPRGFRVRGTLIALRKEQAEQVWVVETEHE